MPFYRHLGMTLSAINWGRAEMRLQVRRELTQDTGTAHGGAVTTLVDSVVGLALYSMLTSDHLITTVELKVNFLAPAHAGVLRAEGRIIHRGKRIAVGEADVRDRNGRLIAKGIVTYMILENHGQRVLKLS
jgi:acyl-CoA thioesterase